MHIAIYILILTILLVLFYSKQLIAFIKHRRNLLKHMSKIPGPHAIPLLGTTYQMKWRTRDLLLQMRGWGVEFQNKGYELVVLWLGPHPSVVVISPDIARAILESNDIITKGPEYDILMPWLGTGLLISTGEKWRSRRKMITPTFHFNILNGFQAVFDHQARIMMEQLETYDGKREHFDIFPYIKRCALDIICETAMGITVSAQTDHNNPYVQAVQSLNILAFNYQRRPWLWLKPIWYATGNGYEYDASIKTVSDFTIKVINERIRDFEQLGGWPEDNTKQRPFLDMLIEIRKEKGLTYEDIREENVCPIHHTSHDTTAAGMGWTTWCLAHNMKCQRKLQEELDEVFGNSDREITVDDLKKLKYLERCIKEALRLRPSVPHFARKVEKDVEINGYTLPKGCSIIISPMLMHFNSRFHENPENYDPDRFLEDNLAGKHPYSYIPFSAGPRNCIGQKFAIQEEKTILATLFRKYTVTTHIPYTDNLPLPEIINRPSNGFPVLIKKRNI
ncbi:hypothetical protein WR25_16590 [Diploscapter pachys]|uniref:Cytochrome P450 n=1 Tax=Diploscapter pachys TaxID=2018661 RepID=A0A2A2KTZ5_9BILA|nr:hypothetical protein WR25_16590 [Diploscapter pachys]